MLSLSVKLYVLGAVLLLTAAGLEVHRRGVVSRERTRLGLLRDDVELYVDALGTSLRNPESCVGVFAAITPQPGATAPVELEYVYDPAREGRLREGGEAWAGTQVKKLNLTLPAAPDMRTQYRGHEFKRYRARLEAEFVVGDRFARGVPAALDLILWLNDEAKVDSCFGPLSVGSVCNMMGGYYDVRAKATEPRCHQIVQTTVGVGKDEVFRGSCRVSGLASSADGCHPRRGALTFQDKMGYGTTGHALCRTCE